MYDYMSDAYTRINAIARVSDCIDALFINAYNHFCKTPNICLVEQLIFSINSLSDKRHNGKPYG